MDEYVEAEVVETPKPVLTLEPFADAPSPDMTKVDIPEVKMDITASNAGDNIVEADNSLTPEEQKQVDEFAAKIDITHTDTILTYGAAAQQKMADFSDKALDNVRSKEMGEIGNMLASLVTELKGFNQEEKGIKGFFNRQTAKATALKARYDKAEVNVNKIVDALQMHETKLLKDVATLDKMYDMNLTYFKELTMYIMAGKKKLEEAEGTILPELQDKAEKSGLPEDAQKARDYQEMCERFSKKITDLELTRTIAMQTAPQIRMIQASDVQMVDKIRSTVVNTIPLWKSQMVIALGIQNSTEAAKAQRAVTDITNQMLTQNADALKMATIETEKESQRGIVDLDTLNKTNQSLISTFDEVMKIQAEGREKRAIAEQEMSRMENELKNKLLEVRAKKD